MKIRSLSATRAINHRSPQGKFRLKRQMLLRGAGKEEAPFEVELDELPPGAANYPLHSHSLDHEFFVVISGRGRLRTGKKTYAIKAGDYFDFPPGEPHQIINDSKAPLRFYVIGNNSGGHDVCYYPDSDKWGVDAMGKIFTATPVDYFHGEE